MNDRIMAKIGEVSWYHAFEILPGVVTPGVNRFDAKEFLDSLGVPADLSGRRALDVGTWDGPLAFELERRGAETTALDLQESSKTGFDTAKEILQSKVLYVQASVYELSKVLTGRFDLVCLLGVFYHLKDPVRAFEEISAVLADGGQLLLEGECLRNYAESLGGHSQKGPFVEQIADAELPLALCCPGEYKKSPNWFIPNFAALRSWTWTGGLEIVRHEFVEDAACEPFPTQRVRGVAVKSSKSVKISGIKQSSETITVTGSGFTPRTAINLFCTQGGALVNLGGLNPDGSSKIRLTVVDSGEFCFRIPTEAQPGPIYLEALNPPFLHFQSSSVHASGIFNLTTSDSSTSLTDWEPKMAIRQYESAHTGNDEIDLDVLLSRMRRDIQLSKMQAKLCPPSKPPETAEKITTRSHGPLAAELVALQADSDILEAPIVSHRRIIGGFIVRLRRLVRDMILPTLQSQADHNTTIARLITHLAADLHSVRDRQSHLEGYAAQSTVALTDLSRQLELRDDTARQVSEQVSELERAASSRALSDSERLQELQLRQSTTERKLRRILFELHRDVVESIAADAGSAVPQTSEQAPGLNYFDFEERFRGSKEVIRQHQQRYVDFFQGHQDVLDLGCGRGEFLEILRTAGINARGVDRDLDMILLCQEKGLEATHGDAFAYLESCRDATLGGIFSAQVIEHLTTDQLVRLVELAHRKLRLGGRLVFETLNPESVFVLFRWYWMDLTHQRLVHPQTIEFLLRTTGFTDVTISFTSPPQGALPIPSLQFSNGISSSLEKFNQATDYLNKLLYGNQEYAVFAIR